MRWLLVLLLAAPVSADVLISSKGSVGTPPPAWTFDQLDSETGSYAEINATTFDIHGESGTIEQGGSFLYQTVTSGNIQIIAEVASFAGSTVANTAAGVMIRSSLLPNAKLAAAHFTADGRTKARSRNTDGGEEVSTALGSSGGIAPQCEALWFNAATSRLTIYENPGPDCSPTAAGWAIVLADNTLNIFEPYFVGLSSLSLQPTVSVTTRFEQVQLSTTNTIVIDPGPVDPECSDNEDNDGDGKTDFDGNGGTPDPGCDDADDDSEEDDSNPDSREGITFTADWETGRINADNSNPDGFYVKGMGPPLTHPASIGNCSNVSGKDGGGQWDATGNNLHFTRVIKNSEGIQSPYGGAYSLRFLIHHDCDFNQLGAGQGCTQPSCIGGPKDKARTAIQTQSNSGPGTLPMNEAVWIGYGTFFPDDWKPETSNAQASNMPIFEMAMASDNSALTVAIERKETTHSETGNQDLDGFGVTVLTQHVVPLVPEGIIPRVTFDMRDLVPGGAQVGLLGRWVPWVWRVVMSNDGSPQGRVELWIDEVKMYGANIPIGSNEAANWHPIFEVYKGDWKDKRHQPSSILSNWPIEYYIDEIRYGIEALPHGAGYDDVHPKQKLCTNSCP